MPVLLELGRCPRRRRRVPPPAAARCRCCCSYCARSASLIAEIRREIASRHFSPKVFRSGSSQRAKEEAGGSTGGPELEPIAVLKLSGDVEEPIYDLVGVLEGIKRHAEKIYEPKRFKGLGEMNPDQLFETTMDPNRRTLLKVTIYDAANADNYFTILMGTDVESRRKFIQEHALDVKNLDV